MIDVIFVHFYCKYKTSIEFVTNNWAEAQKKTIDWIRSDLNQWKCRKKRSEKKAKQKLQVASMRGERKSHREQIIPNQSKYRDRRVPCSDCPMRLVPKCTNEVASRNISRAQAWIWVKRINCWRLSSISRCCFGSDNRRNHASATIDAFRYFHQIARRSTMKRNE